MSPWTFGLVAVVSAYAIYFAVVTVQIHWGFGTSAYDFGLYDQGVWLLSQGKAPIVTLMGRNLFGDHTSFVLLFVVPLFWMIHSSSLLFVVQSVAIAAGAIPIYAYARKRLESDRLGLVLACTYLIHPAVSWINVENYHPDSFLGLFVGVALWAALERKWRWYVVALGLTMLVKEDVALIVAPIGVWVALRRDWRVGVATVVASVVAMVGLCYLVIGNLTGTAFRNSWRIPFGGVSGLIRTAVAHPITLFKYLVSEGRVLYLWQMIAPTGLIFFPAPSVALIGALVLVANIMSTFGYQHQIHYHYSFVIVPALVFGNAYALGRLSKPMRTRAVALLVTCALLGAFLLAPLPLARNKIQTFPPNSPSVIAAHQLFSLIPKDAVISVYHPLSAQLARRERVYVFPNPFERSLYGPDIFASGDRLPVADEIEYVMLPISLSSDAEAVWRAQVHDYLQVASNAWWIVYRHR